MDYTLFGRTGVRIGPLVLGCMMFGRRTTLEESCAIVDRALDAGLNFLDTANSYNDGRSEAFAGEALRRNGKRQIVSLLLPGWSVACCRAHHRGSVGRR